MTEMELKKPLQERLEPYLRYGSLLVLLGLIIYVYINTEAIKSNPCGVCQGFKSNYTCFSDEDLTRFNKDASNAQNEKLYKINLTGLDGLLKNPN